MWIFYGIVFFFLLLFSAFFSSAETSILSVNKIKLNLKAKKKQKRAVMLKKIISNPEEFFSTILIGNNFVNIAAATISTVFFTQISTLNEEITLLISTLVTTIVILICGEILPKSYAFRTSETLAYIYAYPIRFVTYLLFPLVRIATGFSNFVFKKKNAPAEKNPLSTEEIKHFLASELLSYNPEMVRMLNEIIYIAEKDIKSIMTPRLNIIALKETATIEELLKIILEKRITKIPLYKDSLDNITGVVHAYKLISFMMNNEFSKMNLAVLAIPPIFISEYSSVDYALNEFKKNGLNLAVILDEYGSTIGILTLNDIFSEILGEIKVGHPPVRHHGKNQFIVKGNVPVEEVNSKLNIQLPEKKDYTTISGLFVFHFGKLPREGSKISLEDVELTVRRMGKRKIDEIHVEILF